MSRLVMHSSALIPLLEENRALPGHELLAPGSARSAVLNLLYRDFRAGRRSEKEVKALLKRLAEMKIRWFNDRVLRSTAFDVARALEHPDTQLAEYIALTRLQGEALVTQDRDAPAACGGLVRTMTLAEAEAGPEGSGIDERGF